MLFDTTFLLFAPGLHRSNLYIQAFHQALTGILYRREHECVDPPEQARGRPITDTDRPATIKRRKANRDPNHMPKRRENNIPVMHLSPQQHEEQTPSNLDLTLVNSQRRIDLMMAQGRVAYYWAKSTLLGCTPEFADYMGYQQSDLIGVSYDLIHPPEVTKTT
jgi:hypothetical protein